MGHQQVCPDVSPEEHIGAVEADCVVQALLLGGHEDVRRKIYPGCVVGAGSKLDEGGTGQGEGKEERGWKAQVENIHHV